MVQEFNSPCLAGSKLKNNLPEHKDTLPFLAYHALLFPTAVIQLWLNLESLEFKGDMPLAYLCDKILLFYPNALLY